MFEYVLSTDKIKTYKPDPRAYQMAIDALALTKEEILFVAFAGWDAAGAKSFGYTTFWLNRLKIPAERLGTSPDAVGQNLNDVVGFVKARHQENYHALRSVPPTAEAAQRCLTDGMPGEGYQVPPLIRAADR